MSHTKTASHEAEMELIQRAQTAVSQCHWTVGECASQWTKKFARGRTDADFGELVGMSSDQIYQRRRVWDTFANVCDNYAALKWSHFYIALTWEDAAECLSWANDNAATIAEMKAWRRLQLGEDVTTTPPEEGESALWGSDGASALRVYSGDSSVARSESDLELPATRVPLPTPAKGRRGKRGVPSETAGLAPEEYAPFRTGAVTPPREILDDVPGSRPAISVEQTVKRLATMLERCTKAITPEVRRDFAKLPEKVRTRFLAAVKEFRERAAELK